MLLLLVLLCALHSTRADFTFTLTIISHSTSGNCFGDDLSGACETFFPSFCLRPRTSSRSTNLNDCPLGRNTDLFPHTQQSGSRTITSSSPWPGGFQLFFEARDDDAGVSGADHLEDVFINIPLFPVNNIASRIYNGNRVTINMFFHVNCEDDYYGRDCSTLCVPQDNENGHYTCDEDDGSLICLPNYYGPRCRTFCLASQSERDGFYTCDEDDGSRICLDDYYGPECRTHCRPNEFYTCDEDDGSVICREGFTRPQELCTENIDDCEDIFCENGGSCIDEVSSYSCACAAGYEGEHCEEDIDECLEATCPGNSTCVQDAVNSFQCLCNDGFEGENCTEIEPCNDAPCENGGTCVSQDPFNYDCHCPPGFNGTHCELDIDECDEDSSEGGGDGRGSSNVTVCPTNFLCINEVPGFRCVAESVLFPEKEQTEQKVSSMKVIIGAAVAGGCLVMLLILLIIILALFLTKRRMKFYRAERRESHMYGDAPTKFTKSISPNPTYNTTSFQDVCHDDTDTSPGHYHTFENSLYHEQTGVVSQDNEHTAVYEQVTSRTSPPETSSHDSAFVSISSNQAYATTLRSPSGTVSDNPMYMVSQGGSDEAPRSPSYDVPRFESRKEGRGGSAASAKASDAVATLTSPATTTEGGEDSNTNYDIPGRKGKLATTAEGYSVLNNQPSVASSAPPPPLSMMGGYTILRDGRSETAPPVPVPFASKDSRQKADTGGAQSKAPSSKHAPIPLPRRKSPLTPEKEKNSEHGYTVPSNSRRSVSKEAADYNKLDHALPLSPTAVSGKPVRLATIPDSGYTALETET